MRVEEFRATPRMKWTELCPNDAIECECCGQHVRMINAKGWCRDCVREFNGVHTLLRSQHPHLTRAEE